MLVGGVSTQGRFRIARHTRAFEAQLDPRVQSARRAQRIVQSLHQEIAEGEVECLRIRQIFPEPRPIYRLEFELPTLACQRTTLLDQRALDELLAADAVRALVRPSDLRKVHDADHDRQLCALSDCVVPGAGLEPARPTARRF